MRMLLAAVLFAPLLAQAAVVDRVLIRQQWPWKTEVKVDYRVTGLTEAVDVTPTFYDGDTELPALGFDANYVGDVKYVFQDGNHSFTFDPKAAFGLADGVSLEHLRVKLTLTPTACPANYADKLYRIIDLRSGEITDLYRADFYNRKYGAFETSYKAIQGSASGTYTTTLADEFIWTGVTNNPAYKTTKLVLRYIKCKDRVWRQGLDHAVSGSNKIGSAMPEHDSMFTKNYYISVFKVTQAQYYQLKSAYAGEYLNITNELTGLEDHTLPVYNTSRKAVRGAETHLEPTDASFFGRLKALTGIVADVPTDAQWEYAGHAECDMGTNGDMPNGTTSFAYIAHANANNVSPAPVGCYQPNAFGLYDVIGNGQEMVYDDYIAYDAEAYLALTNADGVAVDPIGPHKGSGDVIFRSTTFAPGSTGAGNRNACLFTRDKRSSGQAKCSFRVRVDEEEVEDVEPADPTGASDPVRVLVQPEAWCPFWHTASNASFTVRWPMTPVQSPAKLTVTGICGKPSVVYEHLAEGVCMVTWPIEPTDFRSEDMLTLTLDFSDGSTKTAILGLVGGMAAGDESPNGTRFLSDATGIAWSSVPRKAVAVVPPDALALTNGTEEVSVMPGMTWSGLGPLKSGTELPLTLITEEETLERIVFGETVGALLILK